MKLITPVLEHNLSYQRALGIGIFIATLSGKCNLSINVFYSVLSKAVENNDVIFSFNEGRPESFHILSKETYNMGLSYEIDNLSSTSQLFNSLTLNSDLDFYRILGNFLELLSFSDTHKEYHVADYFIKSIFPPISHSFFHVYYNDKDHPCGIVSWARVSKNLSMQLEKKFVALEYPDWWSGERLFIYDLLAPWGYAKNICRHISKDLFYLDDKAIADRRKGHKVRKAKFLSGRHHKRLINIKLETISKSLHLLSNSEIESNLSDLINSIGEYELRAMLDKENDYFRESTREIISKSASIIRELSIKTNSSNYISRFFDVEFNDIKPMISNFKYELDHNMDYNTSEVFKYQIKPIHVIDIMDQVWMSLIPKLIDLDVKKSVFFDLRSSEDKIDGSFCKFMGKKKKVYLSVKYDSSLKSAILLAHEYSHAVHFKLTSLDNELSIENRAILLEFFAILGELLFVDYLIGKNLIPEICVFSLIESNSFYLRNNYNEFINIDSLNGQSSSYSINYPISFFLSSLAFSQKEDDTKRIKYILDKLIYSNKYISISDILNLKQE
ncbi:cytolysin-activating lysine-acyltransferase [Vibrio crassostreae]|uniref:toxin-activating lysine-acyltransferase n=1 Tax=Vibrio crassostreae TaxID=246167 RepID=UPI0010447F48|nr:toxin-activating lysine-acyltransferase [Vibrio crassostreae]TCN76908.1 hemolysin-activating ACP:hemolysin acyltransferase [Vibrio crassostreae]CAK2510007.1 cytolysin-activating lysine-acyltransferase [Vibrio crassostreae]CAK2520537.1 cytolysin-activating lysine-acyltransferase [Vibrio crassostreae]CAK3859575.1 cytolysin-activating lysine-acyltransferase [Vibrio crassostreae]CAK4006511.1 cytolysin-activating lysine-acyltransferase [Vibrio crassostreae]